jgi:hypothetical protein
MNWLNKMKCNNYRNIKGEDDEMDDQMRLEGNNRGQNKQRS